jgi:mannose-6-phosphate isomerase
LSARSLPPKFVPKPWGSTQLEPWYANSTEKIGEVWFEASLLIKFLFTTGRLSVQVHPNDEQARLAGLERGKTEMWHVLRAEPGAVLGLGFREEISAARLREATATGEVEHLLNWIPVRAGETFFVDANTVHAIGAGLVLCEIQQVSDVTYRLYDYGSGRELHVGESLAVARRGPWAPPRAGTAEPPWTRLAECPYFITDALETDRPFPLDGGVLLVVLEGEGDLNGRPFRAGECWQVDAAMVQPRGRARFLRTHVPPGEAGR